MIQSMDVQLGVFHNVVGVCVGQDCVSILDQQGIEQLIPVKPRFSRTRKGFDPIEVKGEFGDFTSVKGGTQLSGIEPKDVTGIEIEVDFHDPDADFHTRFLKVHSGAGLCLTWELYCEGGNP